jgi:hypothetical protein
MSDRCPDCGGTIVGDGYTMARHCEYVDLPDGREADAPLLTCGFTDEESEEELPTEGA